MKYYSIKARQAGMTLIELTVVLLVLIGLAGLMIPYVAGFISKTHDATGDSNVARLNSTIQRFQTTSMKFPNDLQTLANASGAYPLLMNTTAAADGDTTAEPYATRTYTVGTTNTPINSLTMAGITSIMDLNPNPTSATFDAAGNPVNLTSTGASINVLLVHRGAPEMGATAYTSIEEHLADAFGRQASKFNATCNDYVILGIGQENEMVGKAMSEAPIHFAQNGNMGPDKKYNRFVAVFEVARQQGTPTNLVGGSQPVNAQGVNLTAGDLNCVQHPAKFIGTAMLMMPPHLWGLANAQGHTYANIAAGN